MLMIDVTILSAAALIALFLSEILKELKGLGKRK
jgi:hypothetical protein